MSRNFKVDLPIVAERYEGDIMVDEDIIMATFYSIDAIYPSLERKGGTVIVSSGIDFVCPMSREEVDTAIYKAEYLGEFVLLS